MKIMIDTNIYDKIIGESNLQENIMALIENKKLIVMTTHIQKDQLSKVSDLNKLSKLLTVPDKQISTSIFVSDISRLGEAELGDENTDEIYARIAGHNKKHAEDAIIGITAGTDCDAIVTEDKDFSKKLKTEYPKLFIWNYQEFFTYVDKLALISKR